MLTRFLLAICLLIVVTSSRIPAQDDGPPKSPAESAKTFSIPPDLRLDQVLSEPEIAQPVFCNFDERGRMWVVEYRQYPSPAGLKAISKDQYYRTVYDKVPAAPPNHVRGKDRISIHEDTNGDGKFDSHKVFVDGLNICTAVERGRGGVWVLNPPYLLFYPDANNDDVPDSDPVVHLEGFGLEDTHSCTNSLRWGPDGWLYAAQGSTVTGNMIRPGIDKTPVRSMGQLIWRYHPVKKIYEIFAEGGGNAFGVEIDEHGRVFSGHNGGNTRGFHYPQGGYLRKGFTKHGALSNPYAFGFFPHMKHPPVQRFTHNFIIYEAEALPQAYRGNLFGVEPLQGRVVESDFTPRGSTFETVDLKHPVTTTDRWFCPVDIKLGPDGGIYVCDWYDDNVSHLEASVGKTDKADGRIYRLTARDALPLKPFDLGKMKSEELIEYLKHPNRWFRQTALRLLGDRQDQSILPKLKQWLKDDDGQLALEALWAINQINGLDDKTIVSCLGHQNAQVRKWTVRIACDNNKINEEILTVLTRMTLQESNVETRTQIASSAKRLAANQAFSLIAVLLHHQQDTNDPYQPLLIWWAMERHCDQPDKLLSWIQSQPQFWKNQIVIDHLAERLAKRFTLPGRQSDFSLLAQLLQDARQSNPEVAKKMMSAFDSSTAGMTNLTFPKELLTVVNQLGGASLELQVRQNDMAAIAKAMQQAISLKTSKLERVKLLAAIAEVSPKEALNSILEIIDQKPVVADVQIAALQALRNYRSKNIGTELIQRLNRLPTDSRLIAESILVSRKPWAHQLMDSVDTGDVPKTTVANVTKRRILFHDDDTIRIRVKKIFGEVTGATDEKMRAQISNIAGELADGNGSPYEGKKLFNEHCAKCHRLYQNGGQIGPNLTSYQRTDAKSMLLHIVNPNAEIREGFENIMFALDDGRVISGFVQDEDNRRIVVRTAEGTDISIEKDAVENRKAMPQSLMPAGLLDPLTPQQRRDLFAYLRSTQPLNN